MVSTVTSVSEVECKGWALQASVDERHIATLQVQGETSEVEINLRVRTGNRISQIQSRSSCCPSSFLKLVGEIPDPFGAVHMILQFHRFAAQIGTTSWNTVYESYWITLVT